MIIKLTGAFNVVSLVGVLEPEEVIPGRILRTFFWQIFYCAGGAILEIDNFLASVDAQLEKEKRILLIVVTLLSKTHQGLKGRTPTE